jgi:hypothetical protein
LTNMGKGTNSTKTSTKAVRTAVAAKVGHASSIKAPTHAEVAQRAYEIYEREGRPEGRHLEHWVRAEVELGLT